MEYALCLRLRHGRLSPLPLRIPSPIKPATATTRVTLSSLPLTNTKTSIIHRPLGHGFSPVCAINGFPKASTNDHGDDDGKQIVRGTVGASLALACVLGIITCGCTMSPPIAMASVNTSQKLMLMPGFSHIYPLDGRVALKSLLDTSVYLASKQKKPKYPVLPSWKNEDKPTPKQVAASFKVHFSAHCSCFYLFILIIFCIYYFVLTIQYYKLVLKMKGQS
jgi:hypothetical protein